MLFLNIKFWLKNVLNIDISVLKEPIIHKVTKFWHMCSTPTVWLPILAEGVAYVKKRWFARTTIRFEAAYDTGYWFQYLWSDIKELGLSSCGVRFILFNLFDNILKFNSQYR